MTQYNAATLGQYAVNRPGQAEVIRQRLYDFQVYPLAGQAQLSFFQVPIGQAGTSASGVASTIAKTYGDTNMETAGMLPRPKNYLIESIEIVFEPGSVTTANTFTAANPSQFNTTAAAAILVQLTDSNLVRLGGWLELYIGSKTYLYEAPLGVFPPKVRMEIDAAIGACGTNGQPAEVAAVCSRWAGRPYFMDPPIALESMQNFAVFLKWQTAVSITNNARIGIAFDGVLYRLSQ